MTTTSGAVSFTTSDGLTLRGDEFRPADEPSGTVLMLHGGGQTRHSRKATGQLLAEAGMRVVSLDSRGHGDSDWSADGIYDIEDLTSDVLTAIDVIGAPVTIVGASMGGLTGIAVADQAGPHRVSGLLLVDVVPRFEKGGSKRIREFMQGGMGGFDSLDQAADAIAAYLPHRTRPDDNTGLKRNLRLREDGRWYWHWDPRFMDRPAGAPGIPVDELEAAAVRLSIPIGVIRGRLSDVVSADTVEAFRELVPATRVIELSGAGHTAAGDDNDAFTAAVLEFVRG